MSNIESLLNKLISTKKIVNIIPSDFIGICNNFEIILILSNKKIQMMDFSYNLTAQIILNQKIIHYSLYGNSIFLLYSNKILQRRLLNNWESPFRLENNCTAFQIIAFSQIEYMIRYHNYFAIKHIRINQQQFQLQTLFSISNQDNVIKKICFQLQNRNKKINLIYVYTENKIKKCSMSKTYLQPNSQIEVTSQIKSIFMYKSNSQVLSNYDPEYLVTVSQQAIISFYDIFSNNDSSIFKLQLEQGKNKGVKLVEYDLINKRIWIWIANDNKIISIQLQKQIKIGKQTHFDKFIKNIKKYTTDEKFIGYIGDLPAVMNQRQICLIESSNKDQDWQKRQIRQTRERLQNIKEKILIKNEILNYSRKNQNMKSILIQTQPIQKQKPKILLNIETQTQSYQQTYNQLQQLYDIKFTKLREQLRNQITKKYQGLQIQMKSIKQQFIQEMQKSINEAIVKQLKIHLNETLLPKFEKYFSLTYNRICETFQKGLKYYNDQVLKQQSRMAELNKQVIQKNKIIVQKIWNVLKQATIRLDQKKKQIQKIFEKKYQEINTLSKQIQDTNKKLDEMIKEQDGLQQRIQNTTQKIITQIKLQNKRKKSPNNLLKNNQFNISNNNPFINHQIPPQRFSYQPPIAQHPSTISHPQMQPPLMQSHYPNYYYDSYGVPPHSQHYYQPPPPPPQYNTFNPMMGNYNLNYGIYGIKKEKRVEKDRKISDSGDEQK